MRFPHYSEYKIRRILRHHFLIIKVFGFLQGFTGEEIEEVCAFNEVLKTVGATLVGFMH